jgi:hypothetical protein
MRTRTSGVRERRTTDPPLARATAVRVVGVGPSVGPRARVRRHCAEHVSVKNRIWDTLTSFSGCVTRTGLSTHESSAAPCRPLETIVDKPYQRVDLAGFLSVPSTLSATKLLNWVLVGGFSRVCTWILVETVGRTAARAGKLILGRKPLRECRGDISLSTLTVLAERHQGEAAGPVEEGGPLKSCKESGGGGGGGGGHFKPAATESVC